MSKSLQPSRQQLSAWGESGESFHPAGSWFERSVRFRGRDLGRPDFTVFGPSLPGTEAQFVGIRGMTPGEDPIGAETLLRLMERLAVQPQVVSGHVLRALPVRAYGEIRGLERDASISEPVDGLIELTTGNRSVLQLRAEGPPAFLGAVRAGEELLRRLGSEDFGGRAPVRTETAVEDAPWLLAIELPREWPRAVVLHWGNQFLIGFFRAHAEDLRLASYPN